MLWDGVWALETPLLGLGEWTNNLIRGVFCCERLFLGPTNWRYSAGSETLHVRDWAGTPAVSTESQVQRFIRCQGECNCWQYSHATGRPNLKPHLESCSSFWMTGAGFWPLAGCSASQPLPKMWEDPGCVNTVMSAWKKTASSAYAKVPKMNRTELSKASESKHPKANGSVNKNHSKAFKYHLKTS